MRFVTILPSILYVLSSVQLVQAGRKFHKLMVHGRPFHGFLPPPTDDSATKADQPNLKFDFTQKLNHSDNTNSRTWIQEYWVNQQWYQPGGPIFLMLGGEGPDRQEWVTNEGLEFVNLGKKYNATLFTLEHRFYGLSRPTSDQSVDNLKWLSSRQALADTAFFMQSMNSKYAWTNPQWITFGGSYSGALSAWMRQQYPEIVAGAIASSGPVFAKLDFLEYIDVVQTALRAYSQDCATNIQSGMVAVQALMATREGRANLSNTFNLCPPFGDAQPSTKDIINFYDTIMGNFQYAVQYSQDNRGISFDQWNIPVVCGLMNNNSKSTMDRLADVNNLINALFGNPCTANSYSDFIQCMLNTTFDAECADCNFYVGMCTDTFGAQYNQPFVGQAVDNTNKYYGGRDNYKGTNVVLPNGSIDPWHALGILNNTQNSTAIAVLIDGTAHCADMYPPSPRDLPGLKQARVIIDQNIAKWLANEPTSPPVTTTTAAGDRTISTASAIIICLILAIAMA